MRATRSCSLNRYFSVTLFALALSRLSQPTVFDATAPYARTYEMRQAAERPAMEAEWRAAHAAHAATSGKQVA